MFYPAALRKVSAEFQVNPGMIAFREGARAGGPGPLRYGGVLLTATAVPGVSR
jgi:hypothetical protein